nr:hypothetical protein [uncultured Rhodopila sp.]
MVGITRVPTRRQVYRTGLLLVLAIVVYSWAIPAHSQPLRGGVSQDVFSSGGSGGSAGRGTYTTGSQSHQPNDGPCNNPYGCGRGGALTGGAGAAPYPQGRDVYCQQSPGQPMYGPYHGTGTQTPCGPNFQPAPLAPPQQTAATSCQNVRGELDPVDRRGSAILPARFLQALPGPTPDAALFRPDETEPWAFVERVQSKQLYGGLTIGGKAINPNSDRDYNCTIKFLTVPYNRQNDPRFLSNNTAPIKAQLEDPLRRQIFDAMVGNPEPFRFVAIDTANENIDIRVQTIKFMRMIQSRVIKGRATRATTSCQFTGGKPGILSRLWTRARPPNGWPAPGGIVLDSVTSPGAAHAAIYEFANAMASNVDCLGGVELTIFVGVDRVIGRDRFNTEHPEGLQNIGLNLPKDVYPPADTFAEDEPTSTGAWNGISIFRNLKVFSNPPTTGKKGDNQKKVTTNMMVPGDWVYMQNDPRYPGGDWTGENTIYMGKYMAVDERNNAIYLRPSDPDYAGDVYARFSGLGGETDMSAPELRNDLAREFRAATNLDPENIGWTLLGRIKAGDSAEVSTNAGPPTAAVSVPPYNVLFDLILRSLHQ